MKFLRVCGYQLPVAILPTGEEIHPNGDYLVIPDQFVFETRFEFQVWEEDEYGEMERYTCSERWETWKNHVSCKVEVPIKD